MCRIARKFLIYDKNALLQSAAICIIAYQFSLYHVFDDALRSVQSIINKVDGILHTVKDENRISSYGVSRTLTKKPAFVYLIW